MRGNLQGPGSQGTEQGTRAAAAKSQLSQRALPVGVTSPQGSKLGSPQLVAPIGHCLPQG